MAVEHLDLGTGFKVEGPSWGDLAARALRTGRHWRFLSSGLHMLHMDQAVGFRVMINDGTGTVLALGNTELGTSMLKNEVERWGAAAVLRPLGLEAGVLPLIVPAPQAADSRLVGLLRYGAEF